MLNDATDIAEVSIKGVPAATADKLRKMLAYLDDMEDPEELRSLTAWKAHVLTGGRAGMWSLSVTRNWRLTFQIDSAKREIRDLIWKTIHPILEISFERRLSKPPGCP